MKNLEHKIAGESVTIQFKLEVTDYRRYLYFDKYAKDRRFFPIRIALSLALGLLAAYIHNGEQLEPLFFLGMSLFFFLIFMISPAFEAYLACQNFKKKAKRGDFDEWQIFRFSKKGIETMREDGTAVGMFSFPQVYLAAETKTLLLCYFNKKTCAVIPKQYIAREDYPWLMYLLEVRLRDRFRRLYRDLSAAPCEEGKASPAGDNVLSEE